MGKVIDFPFTPLPKPSRHRHRWAVLGQTDDGRDIRMCGCGEIVRRTVRARRKAA